MRKYYCKDCGKQISNSNHERCKSCNATYMWAIGKIGFDNRTGSKNPAWKGGRVRTRNGYILIHCPSHPRANVKGYISEHIFVWEKLHKKPVPKGWIVHHLNGIKDDNRPVNLVAMQTRKHFLVLRAKAERIQELEALLNNQHQLV